MSASCTTPDFSSVSALSAVIDSAVFWMFVDRRSAVTTISSKPPDDPPGLADAWSPLCAWADARLRDIAAITHGVMRALCCEDQKRFDMTVPSYWLEWYSFFMLHYGSSSGTNLVSQRTINCAKLCECLSRIVLIRKG